MISSLLYAHQTVFHMGIHQFSMSFNERQDRLLWRVSTQEGQEFQFWLTRRLVSRWMPAMQNLVQRVDALQPGTVAPDPSSRQIVSELRHQHVVAQADFQTPYTPPVERPLGAEPMLLTDVQMHASGQDVQLTLTDQTGPQTRQCQMKLTAELVHAWQHLLQQAMDKAQWGLTPPAPAQVQPKDSTAPVYKH